MRCSICSSNIRKRACCRDVEDLVERVVGAPELGRGTVVVLAERREPFPNGGLVKGTVAAAPGKLAELLENLVARLLVPAPHVLELPEPRHKGAVCASVSWSACCACTIA